MRLALWQGTSPASDLNTACDQAEAALAAAAAMRATALVLPEVWLPGYNQPDIAARALPLDSAPLHRLAAASRQHRTALVIGYAERDGDRLYNSAACFGADGTLLCNYRKVQLYGPHEAALYTPGDTLPTFRLGEATAAILICYDVEFAPHVKSLATRGASVILAPTANMAPFTHVPRATVPAMAANHGVTIAYANYCGTEGDLTYIGNSVIAGPHGEILAQAGETPTLLVTDLPPRDPARLSTQAADFRAL
ncbi:nitrilase-related carbon-nitrogen hydrolase [Tabrizicola sp.]|uniref:nitrilase-related carbon-nitrogen hydrolase n=1 Tax=Tabrizicola sp. TaxID=2005166 RepID=UPI0027326BEA|nr:nitrilase-related carbon-nitrogen hydrolase [Tabrizicola sp.]MDP3197080.1 nitrilase-related carbon-nitrogen hydrolase [Tabrizicola sp.]MDZ4065927.1 nitrilase-related carbon-nitrogen hydrolase [Tabrizicola sp.]